MKRVIVSLIMLLTAWLITFNDGSKLKADKVSMYGKGFIFEATVDGKVIVIPWAAVKMVEEL